jgi:multiple sugar transport system permease protein
VSERAGEKSRLGRALRYAVLGSVALAFVMPLVWMVSTSVKPEGQAASGKIAFLPVPATDVVRVGVENYTAVWRDEAVRFPVYLRNTLIVAVLSVVGMTVSSAMVAYALARLRWRGRGWVFGSVLVTMMIPFPVIMAPLFLVFRSFDRAMEAAGVLPGHDWVRMIGTLKPLWVPAWFGGAFNIFLLRQFFLTLPKDLDEAARMDGCSQWSFFWRVVVPLSRPALAVVALFHFVYVWNDFVGPLIFLSRQETFTLALGLQLYQGQAGLTPWNLLMAASTMVVAPVVLVFLVTQRTLVQGIASAGLKE